MLFFSSQIRFNVENGLEEATLPGLHSLSDIAAHTRNYLAENKNEVAAFVDAFINDKVLSLSKPVEQQARHSEQDNQCLSDLFVMESTIDKKRIEDKKGGLLRDCYEWVFKHAHFQQFRENSESRILWIKGDPGKGKTMLLCGIIDELQSDTSVSLSYFFCQAASGNRLNTAVSVLRGLIYHLALHNPELTKHVRKKYDRIGKKLFNNGDLWHDLCDIINGMLQDPILENAILIVDALDECSMELQRLLKLISAPSPAKWIVSSRNQPDIEETLNNAEHNVKIHLEINRDSVSAAVELYVDTKVKELVTNKGYDEDTKKTVSRHLRTNANGAFLWVALVCQELLDSETRQWDTNDILETFPPELDSLYERMLQSVLRSKDAELCKDILAITLAAYRSITLNELRALVQVRKLNAKEVQDAISLCGSFLTVYDNNVSFVHQSAKDYLLNEPHSEILPFGIEHQHRMIFVRSLDLFHVKLKHDICGLQAPGIHIDGITTTKPDSLAAVEYSCTFWVDHILESSSDVIDSENENILRFFKERYLQWLEALSLLRSISAGGKALRNLELYLGGKASQNLQEIVKDARRFLLSYAGIIEVAPLQVYASALIFSPTNSLIRQAFEKEEPDWIEVKPIVEPNWNACLQTLEGHKEGVTSVAFSDDGQRLSSASQDKTVKIWDTTFGTCLHTLECGDDIKFTMFSEDGERLASWSKSNEVKIWDVNFGTFLFSLKGYAPPVKSVLLSNDEQRLVSWSGDTKVQIWDATSGKCLRTCEGHEEQVTSAVFSRDGQRLASGSQDKTVKIWDATPGTYQHTAESHEKQGHDGYITSIVFSGDGKWLTSGSGDTTAKIWNATSGICVHTLEDHDGEVTSVVFSDDDRRLASGSQGKKVKIWDVISGACLFTLQGHHPWPGKLLAFSHNGQLLASASDDKTIRIWDATSGTCVHTLQADNYYGASVVLSDDIQRLVSGSLDGIVKIWDVTSGACLRTFQSHDYYRASVVLSNDGRRLASASDGNTVKIWCADSGACLQTLKSHHLPVISVVFSNSGRQLASGSEDGEVKIWDTTSCKCLQTLQGHCHLVRSVAFSNNDQRLASGSFDMTIKIWDVASGACLKTLEGHTWPVTSVVFSENGERLVSRSDGETVKIWDANSGRFLQTVEGHHWPVALVVSPSSRHPLALGPSPDKAFLFHSKFHSSNLSIDDAWVIRGHQRVLWLPPSYRPIKSVVAGKRVGLGTASGRITIMGFRSDG
ncbi:putative WD repeat-containing protein alr3466 [Ceratocystis fimbriata CBS 114723]|uniref:Putative WD repeat-containing protein alr3466 n=1 Tax=Ceratocystis fimbriata CBS 114723 TaxID=1035309 RepID=A0A2C5WTF8_9PEZI|nr:putative WD repeat-containing protein alr3466 [Ceratocystis fimbriata CBS 114723]